MAQKEAARRSSIQPMQGPNAFQFFEDHQVKQFREVFRIMDSNGDDKIDTTDLQNTFERIGQPISKELIESMLAESNGPITFTVFLTMMAQKFSGIDSTQTITSAFAAFDDNGSGTIDADRLRECLTTMGDHFTDEEVDDMFKSQALDDHGQFHYREFVRSLKHGE
ncbi:EF-hand [Hesseltinella vesiculosa]|uniref:EF-hand n=1 Tax=Hesseltinella vesiculosa TaxID=101127 RepID=A0A1X2GCF1_9FUNG|nr:EF-hand [Hesseltinella vesiculosa]